MLLRLLLWVAADLIADICFISGQFWFVHFDGFSVDVVVIIVAVNSHKT